MKRTLTRSKERFAAIPDRILECRKFQELKYSSRYLLMCIASQFNGENNGALRFTKEDGRRFGVGHSKVRSHGLRDLEHGGFIEKTYQGGMRPFRATCWALSWRTVQFRDNEKLIRPQQSPESRLDHQYRGVKVSK